MADLYNNYYGIITTNNIGMIIDADEYALEIMKIEKKELAIGKNLVTYLPDYSVEDLYVGNQKCNVQILHSENLMAYSLYEVKDKKVYINIVILKLENMHNLFQKIISDDMSEDKKYFLAQLFSDSEDANSAISNIKFSGITGNSENMQELFSMIEKTAATDATLLLTGETGVGKSMFAKVIHESSNRSEQPFVEINCATIHNNLIESELFGYEEGAFTGANNSGKKGKIEMANKGTLFLDEITEMPLDMQQKFLQVLQSKEMVRVGGAEPIKVDFRLITATNRDLEELVKKKDFRHDLYYRINVIPIKIPSLRNRENDIISFIMYFARKANEKYDKNKSFSNDAIQHLCHYSWPGNVRELENVIERLILTSKTDDVIEENELPLFIQNSGKPADDNRSSLKNMVDEYEKRIVLEAYSKYKTSVKVGEKLGLSQTGAAKKIRKYLKNGV